MSCRITREAVGINVLREVTSEAEETGGEEQVGRNRGWKGGGLKVRQLGIASRGLARQ